MLALPISLRSADEMSLGSHQLLSREVYYRVPQKGLSVFFIRRYDPFLETWIYFFLVLALTLTYSLLLPSRMNYT